jgi:hypothetical protein
MSSRLSVDTAPSPICSGIVDAMVALTLSQMLDAHAPKDAVHAKVRDNVRIWANDESNEQLRCVLRESGIVGIVDDVVGGTRILSMMALSLLYQPTWRRVMQHCGIFDPTIAPKSVGECDICGASDDELTELPCKHRFGTTCLAVWLDQHRTCPMCRAEVSM